MATIIDNLYFFNELNLPDGNSNLLATLNGFIIQYEKDYLQKSMGYAFWKEFNSHLTDTEGRWYDLLNGAEYTDANDVLQKWDGLKAKGRTPIACYVYYWFRRFDNTQTSSVGEVKAQTANATNTSPALKMSRAWNLCNEHTYKMWDYLVNAKNSEGSKLYSEFDITTINTRSFDKVSSSI